MNWDQIEEKWAQMARRVRSGLPPNRVGGGDQDPPVVPPGDLPAPPPPKAEVVNAG